MYPGYLAITIIISFILVKCQLKLIQAIMILALINFIAVFLINELPGEAYEEFDPFMMILGGWIASNRVLFSFMISLLTSLTTFIIYKLNKHFK